MKNKINDTNFIMSPKIDFAFKLVFGDEKNKEILIALLSSILRIPKSEFEGIELINTELHRLFEADKKGILDVRVKTIEGKQIDIEIQISESKYMPERSLYYWSKMYASQIKKNDLHSSLKKCITINILDYKFLPINQLHTQYHLFEDHTKHKLTDVIEIHFIELKKLENLEKLTDKDDPAIDWIQFINADTEGEMEMLAEKNENIRKAYKVLKEASMDEQKRMAYESRQMALMDERTKITEALEEGIELGSDKRNLENAKRMHEEGIEIQLISKITEIPIEILKEKFSK